MRECAVPTGRSKFAGGDAVVWQHPGGQGTISFGGLEKPLLEARWRLAVAKAICTRWKLETCLICCCWLATQARLRLSDSHMHGGSRASS